MQSGQDRLAEENLNNEWRLCSMFATVYEVTVGDVKVKMRFFVFDGCFFTEMSENIRLLLRALRK